MSCSERKITAAMKLEGQKTEFNVGYGRQSQHQEIYAVCVNDLF